MEGCTNMVTKEQALQFDEFHYTGYEECSKHVGPKGGITYNITKVRRSGKTQVWKRNPNRFRLPIKYGMYESSAITEDNADQFHVACYCPALQEGTV